MSDQETDRQDKELVLEFELDAPPETVWRAISLPAFREKWLPGGDLANAEPVSTVPGEEIRYRMREEQPPFLESLVAFQIRRDLNGGTILRIVHQLTDTRQRPERTPAANSNQPALMCAA